MSTATAIIEGVTAALGYKAPVALATTGPITLSGLQTIDGVTTPTGARVLVKDQASAVENGIYKAASGDWTRAADFDGARDVTGGTTVLVVLGSINSDTYWRVSGSTEIAVGTDSIAFERALVNDSATVNFLQSGTGARARTAQEKMRESLSVTDYTGIDPTGVSDSYAAISAAITAAGVGGSVRFPAGTYKLSDAISPLDGQTWFMEGCTLKNTTDTKHVIRVNDKDDWSILGSCILQGTLTTAATAAECGLYITDGSGYRVEGVIARKFKGKGIFVDGSTAPPYRSNRGQFVNCSANESTIGVQLDPLAEYLSFSNFNAGGNISGAKIYGGNNIFIGGSIVDNTTGVYLGNGTNHGHGIFAAANINHNSSANIEAVGVINGYTFSGCHIYGSGTSTGLIWLNGCKGITIKDGIIDCWIYNDSGTGSGANVIEGNYFPGDYGVTLNSNNSALGQLYLSGNFGPSGPSDLNDAAPVYVEATRATSTQDVSAGATTLIFNNEVKDNRAAYDSATGIFTAPVAGTYEIEAILSVTASSGLAANSYVTVIHNNTTDLGYIPITPLSGTLGVGSGSVKVTLAANDTVRLKSTITATTPVLAITQSRLSIALVA